MEVRPKPTDNKQSCNAVVTVNHCTENPSHTQCFKMFVLFCLAPQGFCNVAIALTHKNTSNYSMFFISTYQLLSIAATLAVTVILRMFNP